MKTNRINRGPVLFNQFIRAKVFARITDGLLDGTMRKMRSDSRQHHRLDGSAAECDGLEDLPFARSIGNASHLAPGPRGRADDWTCPHF